MENVARIDRATHIASIHPLGPSVILPARVHASARIVADYAGVSKEEPLRSSFLDALSKLQPVRPFLRPDEPGVGMTFAPVSEEEASAFRHVMIIDELPPGWSYGPDEPMARQIVGDALRLVEQVDHGVHTAINTVVGTFLMAQMKNYDGGSISSLMGAIWLALPVSRSVVDFAEIIVHEYVHQCLFLEDMVHSLFLDGESRMGLDDGLVTTAILKIPRGYDKAFHSAFVAVVLAEFYRRLGDAAKVKGFLDPLAVTIPELRAKDGFLTDHGRDVLGDLVDFVMK